MNDGPAAVEMRGVDFRYDGPLVLDRVDLEVREGEYVGVIGPNGGGKTTLLLLCLGLIRPTAGSVRVFDSPPQEARRMLGYVPQRTRIDPDFPVNALDVVLTGRLGHAPPVWRYRKADREVARAAMEQVGVYGLRRRRLGTLSGGEHQRVLIARALACEPRMLLLDEPTANVDHRAEHDLHELLERLNERMTIILVSHDVGCVTEHVQRLVCVHQRVFCHTTEELSGDLIEAIYRGPSAMVKHH